MDLDLIESKAFDSGAVYVRYRLSGDVEGYHLVHAVRGDLLARLGRHDEASAEFERAATLTANVIEQRWLRERVSRCKA